MDKEEQSERELRQSRRTVCFWGPTPREEKTQEPDNISAVVVGRAGLESTGPGHTRERAAQSEGHKAREIEREGGQDMLGGGGGHTIHGHPGGCIAGPSDPIFWSKYTNMNQVSETEVQTHTHTHRAERWV